MEHYSDFYSRQIVVTTAALDAIECLPQPVMEELDTESTIDSLTSEKAPGSDEIPPT